MRVEWEALVGICDDDLEDCIVEYILEMIYAFTHTFMLVEVNIDGVAIAGMR